MCKFLAEHAAQSKYSVYGCIIPKSIRKIFGIICVDGNSVPETPHFCELNTFCQLDVDNKGERNVDKMKSSYNLQPNT